MKKYLSIIVLIAGFLFLGIKLYYKNVAPQMNFQNTVLTLLSNNTKTTINDLRGQVVMVSFFQSWCIDCAKELTTAINNDKFKTLYISDENVHKIEGFKSRFLSDKIVFAKYNEPLSSLGIHVYPTTYLLNKKGKTVLVKLEGYDWQKEKATIEKLLTE